MIKNLCVKCCEEIQISFNSYIKLIKDKKRVLKRLKLLNYSRKIEFIDIKNSLNSNKKEYFCWFDNVIKIKCKRIYFKFKHRLWFCYVNCKSN